MLPMRKIVPASFFRSSVLALDCLSPAALQRCPRLPSDTIILQSRSLAQVQSKHERFPETWYTSASPPGYGWAHHNMSKSEEIKVDERTLRLGNSRQTILTSISSHSIFQFYILTKRNSWDSHPSAADPVTYPSRFPSSARDPIASYFASPLPINSPPSPDRIGKSSLSRGVMDGTGGVGPCPHRGQREFDHPERAHGQEWTLGVCRVGVVNDAECDQGTLGGAMEDMRQNQSKGHGRGGRREGTAGPNHRVAGTGRARGRGVLRFIHLRFWRGRSHLDAYHRTCRRERQLGQGQQGGERDGLAAWKGEAEGSEGRCCCSGVGAGMLWVWWATEVTSQQTMKEEKSVKKKPKHKETWKRDWDCLLSLHATLTR